MKGSFHPYLSLEGGGQPKFRLSQSLKTSHKKKETNVDFAEKLVAALYGVVLLSAVTPLASSGTIKLMECDFPGEIVGVGFDI